MTTVFQKTGILNTPASGVSSVTRSLTGVAAGSLLLAIWSGYQNDQPAKIISAVSINGTSATELLNVDRTYNDLQAGAFLIENWAGAASVTATFTIAAPNSTYTNVQLFEIRGAPTSSSLIRSVPFGIELVSSGNVFGTGAVPRNDCLAISCISTGGDFSNPITLSAVISSGILVNEGSQTNGGNVGFISHSAAILNSSPKDITYTNTASQYGVVGFLLLFDTAAPAQRFKFFVEPSALAVPNTTAFVWSSGGPGSIGAEYTEATGLTFQPVLDAGRAVIYVHCPSSLGLSNGTAVYGNLFSTISSVVYTTGIISGVIEAGAA